MTSVVYYLTAYARRFGVDGCVSFRSRVAAAEYVGADDASEQWAGNGEAFGAGVRVAPHHTARRTYEFNFLILYIGIRRFSGVPWCPTSRRSRRTEARPGAFCGWVLHSTYLSDMHDADAAVLLKGKSVAVIASGKSGFDIAAEWAEANGVENPWWFMHDPDVWGKLNVGYLYVNRFAELMVHKPGAGLASSLVATLLTPLLCNTCMNHNIHNTPFGSLEVNHVPNRGINMCRECMHARIPQMAVSDRVLGVGEPDQHPLVQDDGQVDGAILERCVSPAERAAHGAERGRVGELHEAEQGAPTSACLLLFSDGKACMDSWELIASVERLAWMHGFMGVDSTLEGPRCRVQEKEDEWRMVGI
ncbi:hypothetical protein EJB05_43806, partial [Eragrostis curvula]